MAMTDTVGSYEDYAFTGDVQTFTVPRNGIYKLECDGAGGNTKAGGRSLGYAKLKRGDVLYICVGGLGDEVQGGYNGGGKGVSGKAQGYGGGGATHMAMRNGTLAELGNTEGLLIVAGGAGGGTTYGDTDAYKYYELACGEGGGLQGGNGATQYYTGNLGKGGTQTEGFAFGQGGDATIGAGWKKQAACGGGGGLYGGSGGNMEYFREEYSYGAGGGSGYVGGVPSFTYKGVSYENKTVAGGADNVQGAGRARITFVAKTNIPVIFNGGTLDRLIFNGQEVEGLIMDGVRVFMRHAKRILKRGVLCGI